MIKYSLKCCEFGHTFEGWFRNSEDFNNQQSKKLITCPICDSSEITKQLMAPNVSTRSKELSLKEKISKLKTYVEQNFENVGDKFADELIAIHEGTSEDRPLSGKINKKDRERLSEADIPYYIIPEIKGDA